MVRGFKYQIYEEELNHLCSKNKHSHEMCSYCKADLCLCFRISIKQIFSICTPASAFCFPKNRMPPTDVNQVLKFRSGGGWGHGAYDQRIKVIAKMLKKVGWLREGWGSGWI